MSDDEFAAGRSSFLTKMIEKQKSFRRMLSRLV